MKKIEGYLCEKCDTTWATENQAVDCEKFHIEIEQLEIKGAIFKSPKSGGGDSNIPAVLIIHGIDKNVVAPFNKRFSARYTLKDVNWIPGNV